MEPILYGSSWEVHYGGRWTWMKNMRLNESESNYSKFGTLVNALEEVNIETMDPTVCRQQ